MVEVICIDGKNKPKEIPESKWLKEGNKYNVIFTVVCLPQKELGFCLAEIELTESEMPFEFFLAKRFGITEENIEKMLELIKYCSDTNFSIEELMEQTQLEEV